MNWKPKSYPAYKDSGLPWLGKIPKHWEMIRTKYIFCEIDNRSTTGTETHFSMSQKYGLVESSKINERRLQSESYISGKLCSKNDLVLNRLKAHLGVFAYAPQDGVVSPDYSVFRLITSGEVRFFEMVFKIPEYVAELRRSTKGIVEGFWRLYSDDFYNIRVPVPPVTEQRVIIHWIDRLDRRVRRFIRNKSRQIELLNEQKQAIIQQAVTSGLNPKVRLKPSGFDWLGDIPEHWNIYTLKQMAIIRLSGVDKHSIDGEIYVRLCNYTDVYKHEKITSEIDFMSATATQVEISAYTIKVGDILITKDSESWEDIAVPALVAENIDGVLCGYHLALIRPKPEIVYSDYLYRSFTAPLLRHQFNLAATGVTRYGLSKHAIKNAIFPLPPIIEQERICHWLEKQLQPIKIMTEQAQREISIIREYRTRLIADVVTGNVDVRHLAIQADEFMSEDFYALDDSMEEIDDELLTTGEYTDTEEGDYADD